MLVTSASPTPWLHSRRYDLAAYVALPFVLYVLLTSASAALGPKGPWAVYMAQTVLTGLPHNMITWLLLLPASGRRHYAPGVLVGPAVLSALALAPTIWWYGTPAFAWAISLTTLLAYFHITRQHQGLLAACDARFGRATGESDIRATTRDLRWLVGAVAASAITWKATGAPMTLGLVGQPMNFVFQPVPLAVPAVLTGLAVLLALRFGVSLWRRHREGLAPPSAHLAIGGGAIANLVLASLVPNEQFFLTLALVSSYHNLQYFAFCYTHHHQRASAEPDAVDVFSRWAREGRFARWVALPIALGVGFAACIALLPAYWTAVAANAFMISHYFVDGNMWRRRYYPALGRFLFASQRQTS